MRTVVTWVVAVVAALLIVGMVAYARGGDHHRGDEIGSNAAGAVQAPRRA